MTRLSEQQREWDESRRRYREELDELCSVLNAKITPYFEACKHTLTGETPKGEHRWGRWHCVNDSGIYLDHDVTLRALDKSWTVRLGQPYRAPDYKPIMPDGVVCRYVGPAPYYPESCSAFLVGSRDVVAWLTEPVRDTILMFCARYPHRRYWLATGTNGRRVETGIEAVTPAVSS